MKKVVLITGTSTGLGLATSVLMAKKGHTVYATMRNLQKREELEDKALAEKVNINISRLNVSDPKSITQCVNEISERDGRIDILLNNAGAGFLCVSEQVSEPELLNTTDTNYHGVVRIRTSAWANEFCRLKTQADPDGLKLVEALTKSYFN